MRKEVWTISVHMPYFHPGGYSDMLKSHFSSFEKYDPLANQWTMLKPMYQPRKNHGACVLQNQIYVFGGYNFCDVVVF